jgi:hypothetical protein
VTTNTVEESRDQAEDYALLRLVGVSTWVRVRSLELQRNIQTISLSQDVRSERQKKGNKKQINIRQNKEGLHAPLYFA